MKAVFLTQGWLTFCLSNQIDNPTRVTKTSKSLIDVLLTSHAECYATSGSLHLGLSDHDLMFKVRKNRNSRPKPRLIEFRSMKNLNLPDFLADLRRVPWSSLYTFNNADDVWVHWGTLCKDVLNQHVPLKIKTRIFRVIIEPILLYGSEAWTLSAKQHPV